MSEKNFRSTCPISTGLDLFGDKWSLLIVRDLLYHGKRTFKDFSTSGENISSARLSDRLGKLEKQEILTKTNHPTNKKVFIYQLTQKGKDLAPIIAEFVLWGDKYLHNHISEFSKSLAKQLRDDKEQVLTQFQSH